MLFDYCILLFDYFYIDFLEETHCLSATENGREVIALCSNKVKELTMLLISDGYTVLDLWLVEPPGSGYGIDSTD